jgi:hypothetical protein
VVSWAPKSARQLGTHHARYFGSPRNGPVSARPDYATPSLAHLHSNKKPRFFLDRQVRSFLQLLSNDDEEELKMLTTG